MSCSRVREERARRFFEGLRGIFSVADCTTSQTIRVLTGLSYLTMSRYLNTLVEAGYIEIHRVQRGRIYINLYCLPGKRYEKIYIYDGRKAYLIRLIDVINALEKMVKSFSSYTAAVRIRLLKEALNLPNTVAISLILRHIAISVIKDAVIREEVRDVGSSYSLVLVVDKEKALKLIEEYKRGSPLS